MFSSYESQGLRDLRNWGLWFIYPDGTGWGPLVSSFQRADAYHFHTQLANGSIVFEAYYNANNFGFGTLYRMPSAPEEGYAAFGPADRNDARNSPGQSPPAAIFVHAAWAGVDHAVCQFVRLARRAVRSAATRIRRALASSRILAAPRTITCCGLVARCGQLQRQLPQVLVSARGLWSVPDP